MKNVVRLMSGFAQLTRVQYSPLTMSIPMVGGLAATSGDLDWRALLSLAVLGFMAHLFGFGLNDVIDAPIDRQHPERQDAPLVAWKLTQMEAIVFVIAAAFAGIGWLLLMDKADPARTLIFGVTSMGFSVVYNRYSKRGVVPPLIAELGLAVSVVLLMLTGAYSQTVMPEPLTLLIILVCGLLLHWINAVPNGLKDLALDQQAGARSFVISTGAKVTEEGQVQIPLPLRLYGIGLNALVIGTTIGIAFLTREQYQTGVWWGLFSVSFVLQLVALMHLWYAMAATSFKELERREPLAGSLLAYAGVLVVMNYLAPIVILTLASLATLAGIARFVKRQQVSA